MTASVQAPDYSGGYLRIPLLFWLEVYCRAPLTRRQLQILSLVIRESWGWQEKGGAVQVFTRPLTPRQISEATGLSTDHLRQDLSSLIRMGVLGEQNGRYYVVPQPKLWKTSRTLPPIWRSVPLKSPTLAADSALPQEGVKTEDKDRNVPPSRSGEFSTTGENSPTSTSTLTLPLPSNAERFVAVVQAFVGPLDVELTAQLIDWLARAGIARVWRALEPLLRQDATQARGAVEAKIKEAGA